MPRTAQLNNVDHKHLRIDTRRVPGLGDDVMSAPTFPSEFRSVQAHYPIVFGKTAQGGFQPLALFGFQDGENLFVDATGWDADYVPLAVERQPFLVGVGGQELTVHVDLDSPRVVAAGGEAVFLEHGGTTPYLERINSVLLSLYQGLQEVPAFVAALLEHGLLESFTVDVQLDDGSQHRLAGYYTIHEERLAALGADALAQLHTQGHLQAAYMVVASASRFRALIARRNRRDATAHA